MHPIVEDPVVATLFNLEPDRKAPKVFGGVGRSYFCPTVGVSPNFRLARSETASVSSRAHAADALAFITRSSMC